MKRVVELPDTTAVTNARLCDALAQRQSMRDYARQTITLEQLGALLWAAQGVTRADGGRTAPSAGGFHPLRLYVAAGNVDALDAGVYLFEPLLEALVMRSLGDMRGTISELAMGQEWMRESALIVTIVGEYGAITQKYGKRAIRYLYVEAGAAGQNLALAATAVGLGTATVGAFDDSALSRVLGLGATEYPLTLMTVGIPQG